MDDVIGILALILFVVAPMLDKKKKKVPSGVKKKSKRRGISFRIPELRHAGESVSAPVPPETTSASDEILLQQEAELRDEAHTAAYEAQRKLEEAAARAEEEAAYERAAKLPSVQTAPQPRIEMTAAKAREAFILATILGEPKVKRHQAPSLRELSRRD